MAKEVEDLRKLSRIALGGALVTKSVGVMGHVGSPTALAGDVAGFAGIGVAGAASNMAFGLAVPRKRKRKRKGR